MVRKNLLLVPQAEELLQKYKEEIAHEFGIFHSVTEMDYNRPITDTLLNEERREKNERKKGI